MTNTILLFDEDARLFQQPLNSDKENFSDETDQTFNQVSSP
jgi:hypothetical protein